MQAKKKKGNEGKNNAGETCEKKHRDKNRIERTYGEHVKSSQLSITRLDQKKIEVTKWR